MAKHRCFEVDVDGVPVRINGDPKMDPKTLEALMEMARLAMKAIADGTLPPSRKKPAHDR